MTDQLWSEHSLRCFTSPGLIFSS